YRQGVAKVLVDSIADLSGGVQPTQDSAFKYGCGWHESARLTIPDTWRPGIYFSEYPESNSVYSTMFLVRSRVSHAGRVLVDVPINTWEAYNGFGGKSLYDANSVGGKSAKVSFYRPFDGQRGLGQYLSLGARFFPWLE